MTNNQINNLKNIGYAVVGSDYKFDAYKYGEKLNTESFNSISFTWAWISGYNKIMQKQCA